MKNNLRLFLLFMISYLLFGPTVISFAQSVFFSAPTNFAAGITPFFVAVGDFNGDGKQDLAVANHHSDNVSILLGNGNGSFGLTANFAAGLGPTSVAVGDFNGDGRQDLAVLTFSSTVSILLGNGDGSFGTAMNFAAGLEPTSVAVGDFNGNGKLDLAVANGNSNNVSILLGNGAGGFGTATNFAVEINPTAVAVRDFNGNGKLDLAVANFHSGNVSILLGNGDGTFDSPTNFAAGLEPFSVAVGDFNGDGKPDLVVANSLSNNVSILLNVPSISIGNVTVSEGNAGTINASFPVNLSTPSTQTVAVTFSTADGTGTAGTDYVSITDGTLTFTPGDTTKTISVAVNGDNIFEPNESFFVQLTSPTNATIVDGQGIGTITNDDLAGRLSNISTRGRVLTGDNAMIGGFIIEGSAAKRVVVRSRGPSMGGAPFFVPGTLANPLLRLFSGQTMIAQNDNWQDAPSCSGFVCEGAAAIVATGLDPCEPNPGQIGPPPNCALESAILITLPPGGYTGIVTGADGGTGVGLVEVFEADASPLSELSNISTRGFVQTGDNIMIGGLIIEATAPKTVLIRARGPSMSGAPFNLSGTLANPLLLLFSGQTVVAFNDNWRDLQGDEVVATGIDPCLPNPGQAAAPPGCDQESAMVLDLPGGAYTAWLTGVGGQTGIGLVEVFEVPDVIIPSVLGNYVGSGSVTVSQCTNPANNQVNNFFSAINISSQNGSIIGGAGTFSGPVSANLNIAGTVTAGFDTMGSFTFTQLGASGDGTFTGASIGNTMTLNFTGQVIITGGGSCTLNGSASGNR